MTENNTILGEVKWFSESSLRYGFIKGTKATGYKDILVHYSVIDMAGFKMLRAGDRVRCEYVTENGKHKATFVTRQIKGNR